jgi:hypothetical protein
VSPELNTTFMTIEERLDRLEAWMNMVIEWLDELKPVLIGALIGFYVARLILL